MSNPLSPADPNPMLSELKEALGSLRMGDLTSWVMMPGERQWVSREGETSELLEGVYVNSHETRSWWSQGIGQGSNFPDCSSYFADFGTGRFAKGSSENPSGACQDCPMSQWGSGATEERPDTSAQSCRAHMLVYLVPAGEMLPCLVWLPPTSIPVWRRFLISLVKESHLFGIPVSMAVVTERGEGIAYPKLVVSRGEGEGDPYIARHLRSLVVPDRSLYEAAEFAALTEA